MDTVEKIKQIIATLDRDGILARFPGNCILASDILQNLLDAESIPSKIVEVQAVISTVNPMNTSLVLLGYDTENLDPGNTDTHTVIVTQTEPALLVDASIGHILNNARAVVLTELSSRDPEIIAETVIGGHQITYRVKKNIRMPYFHQRDLVSKMKDDLKLRTDFKAIRFLAVLGLTVSLLNVVFNSILLGLKILFP